MKRKQNKTKEENESRKTGETNRENDYTSEDKTKGIVDTNMQVRNKMRLNVSE